MTIPAVVSILDLATAAAATTGMRFEASYTSGGVQTTVQVGLDQMFTTGFGTLPTGGGTGQILNKSSGGDFATVWSDVSSFVGANATSGLTVTGSTTLALALASVAGLSVIGAAGTTTAIPLPITASTGALVLRANDAGTGVGWGAINLGSSAAVTGVLPGANMSAVNLATTGVGGVQNVLPVARGGLGTGSFAAFALLYGNVTSAIGTVAATTAGMPLVSAGTGAAPIWTTVLSLTGLAISTAVAMADAQGNALTPVVQEQGTQAASSSFGIGRWANSVAAPRIILGKSRGAAVGTQSAVLSGDGLGEIVWVGDDGTDFAPGASIRAVVDGTTGNNDMPGRIVFGTTSDGAAAVTDRMTLDSVGALSLVGAMSIASAVAIPAGGSTTLGYKVSSAANFGVFFGSGAPSLAAGTGSLYIRSDGSTATTRLYTNLNGSTTWTAFVASA